MSYWKKDDFSIKKGCVTINLSTFYLKCMIKYTRHIDLLSRAFTVAFYSGLQQLFSVLLRSLLPVLPQASLQKSLDS